MKDLSPRSFQEHSMRIFREEKVAMQYRNNRFLEGPGVNVTEPCDYDCRMDMFCQTTANDYDEWQFCRDDDKFDLHDGAALLSIMNLIDYRWMEPK